MTALKHILSMALAAVVCYPAAAEVPSADVMIQSIVLGTDLKLKVVLFSHWDDTARNVKLHITLPYGIRVGLLPAYCYSVAVVDGTNGSISCEIGDMNVGTTRTVYILLIRAYTSNARGIGAFVWNTLPDPMPSNNFAQTVLP